MQPAELSRHVSLITMKLFTIRARLKRRQQRNGSKPQVVLLGEMDGCSLTGHLSHCLTSLDTMVNLISIASLTTL